MITAIIIIISVIATIVVSYVSYQFGKANSDGGYFDFLQERTSIVRLNGHDYLFVNLVGYAMTRGEAIAFAKNLKKSGISAILFGGEPPMKP